MDDALVLIRIGLAAVFLVAGAAKLLDRPGSRRALVEFGLSERVAAPLHLALPAIELITAAGLLLAPSARLAGLISLILLVVFVAGLTRVLRRGEAPACHCFGQVHSEPASWLTVARNVALAAPAAYVAAAARQPNLASWAGSRSAAHLGLLGTSTVAVLASLGCLVLWRQNRGLRSARPLTALRPVKVGAPAPGFSLPAGDRSTVTLRQLLAAGRPCLLTFVAPRCGPCVALLPEIARWRETFADDLTLSVLMAGDAAAAGELAEQYGLVQVLADERSEISLAYGVPGTPCAVLVGADGSVKSAPAPGHAAIEELVRIALRGDRAPDLGLQRVG